MKHEKPYNANSNCLQDWHLDTLREKMVLWLVSIWEPFVVLCGTLYGTEGLKNCESSKVEPFCLTKNP
uniref:Uncharacterized protein n=1 Tax=Anguilla anguilla TaxID=7936 RepID=A0A0E9XD93_ANGAN